LSSDSSSNSLAGASSSARAARLFASPLGVMIAVPGLVIAVGVVAMLLGRSATRDASESMARAQLVANARDVEHEIAFALDQAQPMLETLRPLVDPDLPLPEVAMRMRDVQAGRAGVTNVSLGFPNGVMRGTFVDPATRELRVQESRVRDDGATTRVNYRVVGRELVVVNDETTDYDVRVRPHYTTAMAATGAVWMAPRVYFTSKTTGITATEAVRAGGTPVGVMTVDLDVGALSEFLAKAPYGGARTIVFARDGTILAAPGLAVPAAAAKAKRLLHAADYADPAITALMATIDGAHHDHQRFVETGGYLASVTPIGGTRAGIATPLDWYHATIVPRDVLFGPTARFSRQALIISLIALVAALGISLIFAWNLVRMRHAVTAARSELRDVKTRVRELGSYRLVAKLGAGGMGEVWRAEHRLLARAAAIKLVRPDAMKDPTSATKLRARFRREACTLAAMKSRNTIQLYDYGVTEEGTFYFVMELLDGCDLENLVREFGGQPAARVIDILIQACNSLAEAHDAGLIHRDIKPANLFVSRAADEVDVVKLLDFGIVQSLSDPMSDPLDAVMIGQLAQLPSTSGKLTSADAIVGTPGYIAPEVAGSGPGTHGDARADLYALGCVAWWLLTGSEVFPRSRDALATILVHVSEAVPELRQRVTGWLPPELEQLVRACLAKSPEDRPKTARALAEQLRAIAIPAEHAWRGERAAAWWYVHKPAGNEPSAPADVATARLLVPVPLSADEAPTSGR